MNYKLLELKYKLEMQFTKLQRLFGYKKDTSVIPKGYYCYEDDDDMLTNENGEPKAVGGYYCKYYRHSLRHSHAGCTYLGFLGEHDLLSDSVKICGINKKNHEKL